MTGISAQLRADLETLSDLHDADILNIEFDIRERSLNLVVAAVRPDNSTEIVRLRAHEVVDFSMENVPYDRVYEDYHFPHNTQIDSMETKIDDEFLEVNVRGIHSWTARWKCRELVRLGSETC